MKFNPGDTVTLKAGGPKMSVDGGNEDTTTCTWFDGKKRLQATFTTVTLVAADQLDKILEEIRKAENAPPNIEPVFVQAKPKS